MSVNFEVTHATGSMLSVNNCTDSEAITIFKPYDGGRIIKDACAIQNMITILDETMGFVIFYGNGADVLNVKISKCDSAQSKFAFPVIRND